MVALMRMDEWIHKFLMDWLESISFGHYTAAALLGLVVILGMSFFTGATPAVKGKFGAKSTAKEVVCMFTLQSDFDNFCLLTSLIFHLRRLIFMQRTTQSTMRAKRLSSLVEIQV